MPGERELQANIASGRDLTRHRLLSSTQEDRDADFVIEDPVRYYFNEITKIRLLKFEDEQR